MTEFERKVMFVPGYNYLHETGPKRRGQHGMAVQFFLLGDEGVVHWIFNTMWTPLGEVDKPDPLNPGRDLHEPVHCDYTRLEDYGIGPSRFGYVRPPSGTDIGHHWPTPLYDGEHERTNCEWLSRDGTPRGCYSDGSGLRADEILRRFIAEGDTIVWAELETYYDYCKISAARYARGERDY